MNKIFYFAVILLFTINCGFNKIQELDENVKSSMAEILNQYKRRADLIPGLIKIVEAYATHEKEIFVEIAKLRNISTESKFTSEELNNPELMKKFQAAQNGLGSSINRIFIVLEKYPDLKAKEGFLNLQAQLEGTENRIAVARGRHIKAVRDYNILIRQIPEVFTAKIFNYTEKTSFEVENEADLKKLPANISNPPEIEFGKKK
jgi:LemA protein